MYIKDLAVLNTVTALGADLNVSTDGNTYITNVANPIPSASIKSVTITSPVAAVAGVITITPTAANSTLYKFTINAYNTETGNTQVLPVSYTSLASGDTATTICDALRAQINNASGFSVAATGTATLVLTGLTTPASGTTPYVTFSVGGASASLSSASSSGAAVVIFPNLSAVRTTQSVVGYGLGSILLTKYNPTSSFNLNYAQAADIVTTNSYAEVDIQYVTPDTGIAVSNVQSLNEATILVNTAATNYADLLGTYGTLTGLQAGYKVVITAPATTTAAVTVTTGAIALAGGSVTFATLGAQSGDYIVIGSDITKITGVTGLTAGFGTLTTAVGAATFKYASWSNIPF